MTLRAIAILGLALGVATPVAAQREVVMDRIMMPYALSYAACVHRATLPCDTLRADLIRQSDPVFRRYTTNMVQVAPRFVRLLEGIDRGAARLRAGNETPSAAVVDYMQCLGDSLQADSRFLQGVAIDPLPALDQCVPQRKAIPVTGLATDADKRNHRYLFNLEAIVNAPRLRYFRVRDGLLGRPDILFG